MRKKAILSALVLSLAVSADLFSGDRPVLADKYRRWLNEEVVYIISGRERKGFLALATDTERENFIERFWQARDPDSATEENEYRREHYDRIRYANEKFDDAVDGWRTERGRVYIIHGPPDSISFAFGGNPLYIDIENPTSVITGDSNPDRRKRYRLSFTTPETEIWVYHRLGGAQNFTGYFEVIFSRLDASQLYQLNQVLRHIGPASLVGQRVQRDYEIMNFLRGQRIGGPYRILYAGEYKFPDVDALYDSAFHPFKLPSLSVMDFQLGLQDLEKPPGEILEQKLALSRQLKERIKSRIFFQKLSLNVYCGSVRSDQGGTLIPLTISFGPEQAGDTVDLLVELSRPDGRTVASFVDSIKIASKDAGQAAAAFLFQTRLLAHAGRYKLFVYASARDKPAAAQFSQDMNLPDYSGSELAMSDVLLFQKAVPREQFAHEVSVDDSLPKFVGGAAPLHLKDFVLVPAAAPRFRRRENLTAFFEVYNPGLNGRQPDLQVKCRFWKGGELLAAVPDKFLSYVTETQDKGRAEMSTAYGLTIPLRTFYPGEYSLELEVFDRILNRNVTRQTTFTVY
ncbi:MAG TPA: GWxTD domain-containing protein [Acidobacteriota bacterium]|jgi:GWxTD domain-containing protein